MPFNWNPTTTNFNDKLWDVLKEIEAPTESERFNVSPVGADKNLTIGIGFDLNAGGPDVRIAVYKGMGLKGELLELPPPGTPPPSLTAEQQIERAFLDQLEAAVVSKNQSLLDAVMSARNAAAQSNTAYATYIGSGDPRTIFAFQNDHEVRAVFDDLWPNVYREIIFAKYPFLETDPASHSSREMLTLASLSWNGAGALLGPKLGSSLQLNRRAEAWFEIRHNNNGGRTRETVGNGIAKRRYMEAHLFGLYDDIDPASVTLAEATSVYQMLQRHRRQIIAEEINWGTDPIQYGPTDWTTGPKTGAWAPAQQIKKANTDYAAILDGQEIRTLVHALQPARNALVASPTAR